MWLQRGVQLQIPRVTTRSSFFWISDYNRDIGHNFNEFGATQHTSNEIQPNQPLNMHVVVDRSSGKYFEAICFFIPMSVCNHFIHCIDLDEIAESKKNDAADSSLSIEYSKLKARIKKLYQEKAPQRFSKVIFNFWVALL